MSNQPPQQTHRSLTGVVTKLVGDGLAFGFINDEVFFSQSNVSGGPAAVGDQVHAECDFSAHLPIKWNANSIRVITKGSGQHVQANNPTQPQQQQDHEAQQNQFNQSPVAVTYQQHRQQRQQRHMLDVNKPNDNSNKPPERLLDQATNMNSDPFYGSNNNPRPYPSQGMQQQAPQQQQQQQDTNIQPFQDQPMGPPNFTYTSQLGSAFVQNQFVPAPFLAQQAPPMLPHQQQQQQQHLLPQQQQHLLPQTTNQMHNQNHGRSSHHNKGGGGGGRFNNNQGDNKNEGRHNNRRNQNRNDDRSKSGDRDNQHNNRSNKSDNRDKSGGRNNKRLDDIPVRPSPPPHSSARSTTSMSSDRGNRGRRHYEIQNIPKTMIMTNMNAHNMKQRCPSSIHVPSDLKDILVNKYFRLDIKNTPKPVKFSIEQAKKDTPASEAVVADTKPTETAPDNTTKKELETKADGSVELMDVDQEAKKDEKVELQKLKEENTPPCSKSDVKLNHKYGVKVILFSLPELDEIYRTVFGNSLDSYNSDSKNHSRLDEAISLLCNRGSNNGYSLIGGKFDPVTDGFVEGEVNEFERHGFQPDLIATCKRVVMEQTALDLGECKNWTLLSTFVYNNKSDYFSSKASIEYSFIYIPQIWTILSESFDKGLTEKEVLKTTVDEDDVDSKTQPISDADPVSENQVVEQETDNSVAVEQKCSEPSEVTVTEQHPEVNETTESIEPVSSITAESLAELKVTDLKAELDRREIKYKGNAKKAELISLLQDNLHHSVTKQEEKESHENVSLNEENDTEANATEANATEANATEANDTEANDTEANDTEANEQLEEGEVVEPEASNDSPPASTPTAQETVDATSKRKFEESGTIENEFKSRGDQQLSLITLNEATQASRYDQFELSVASNLLKESLIQHLSEYILTVLIEDSRQKTSSTASNSSSQETGSDTNNNSTKATFKNPSEHKMNLKELPVDRYINLAFSYFDSTHMGYLYFEDLNKLFNNTGLTISKRALMSLVEDNEKLNYRLVPDLSSKLPPTFIYKFPGQFNCYSEDSAVNSIKTTGKTIVYEGVSYDVEKLIHQVRETETLRVSLVDRFNYAIENSDKQQEEIHVLEVSQKSLAKAIKAQNDEICDLKRERDSMKKRFDILRKGVKGTITSLSDLVKDEKPGS